MRTSLLITLLVIIGLQAQAQNQNEPVNLATALISNSTQRLNIGGYGQVDFSSGLTNGLPRNASLDVSRVIFSMGYRFSDKTQFLTEIEFEHVNELYVEQAFLNHSFSEWLNFRAGLLLIPMGIINEYHEPSTFNGVLRPSLDNVVIPTTWREIGAGFTGRIGGTGLKYQLYVVNGFNGYTSDGKGLLTGSGFVRSGRQKGARSYMSAPNLSAKIDYFGIRGLKLGLAGYFGDTQSALYNRLDPDDDAALARADSSSVRMAMVALDARYDIKGFHFRGQWVYSSQEGSAAYNALTGNDLGALVSGYYLEGSYNVLRSASTQHQLIPFLRFEHYDTHAQVAGGEIRKDKYNISEWVFGLGWKPVEGAVFKIDTRLKKSKADAGYSTWINAGIGVWF